MKGIRQELSACSRRDLISYLVLTENELDIAFGCAAFGFPWTTGGSSYVVRYMIDDDIGVRNCFSQGISVMLESEL